MRRGLLLALLLANVHIAAASEARGLYTLLGVDRVRNLSCSLESVPAPAALRGRLVRAAPGDVLSLGIRTMDAEGGGTHYETYAYRMTGAERETFQVAANGPFLRVRNRLVGLRLGSAQTARWAAGARAAAVRFVRYVRLGRLRREERDLLAHLPTRGLIVELEDGQVRRGLGLLEAVVSEALLFPDGGGRELRDETLTTWRGVKLARLAGQRDLRGEAWTAGWSDLQVLDLRRCRRFAAWEDLVELPALEALVLGRRGEPATPGVLQGAAALRCLVVEAPQAEWDFPSLGALAQLVHLGVRDAPDLDAATCVAALPSLEVLDLAGCERLSTLPDEPFGAALRWLSLAGCRRLTSLGGLAGATTLAVADFDGCGRLAALEPLAGLEGLQWLRLRGCGGVADFNALGGLRGLTYLDLQDCTQLESIHFVEGKSALLHLNLSGCTALADLTPLTGLRQLRALSLWGCERVLRLDALSTLSSLEYLELPPHADELDLERLAADHPGLRWVRALGCRQISSDGVERFRRLRPDCEVY